MRSAASLLLLVMMVCVLGCAAGPSQTAQPVPADQPLTGTLGAFYPHPIGNTETAADSVLGSIGLVIVDRQDTDTGRYIEARRADNTPVFVHLVKLEKGTQVRVRVGLFGDLQTSRWILDAIGARLKEK